MKQKTFAGLIVAGLLTGGSFALLAQNGPGPKGCGYGGPPASEAERAARRQACPQTAQCPGPCVTGEPRGGRGPGLGNGQGQRRGVRDGTGPRSGKGTCPVAGQPPGKK